MKKLIIATMILLSIILAFSACGGKTTNTETTHTHINETADHACDICGKYLKGEHVFSDEFTYTKDFHYRATICCESNFAKDKGDHTFEERIIVAPTCSSLGEGETYCTVCGYAKPRMLGMLDHPYDAILYDEEYHWYNYTCDCGYELKNKHYWRLEEVIEETSCSKEGTGRYECTDCDATKIDIIEKIDHKIDTTLSRDEDYHWYAYSCGCHELEEKIPHSWYDDDIIIRSTCATEGLVEQRCSKCNLTREAPLAKVPHKYSNYSYKYDNFSHWRYNFCSCDVKIEEEEHTLDITNTCTVCKYQLTATDGFVYELSEDYSEYYLTGTSNMELTEAIVPSELFGKPVTRIMAGAFKDSAITKISIPNTITAIDTSAFEGTSIDEIEVDSENETYQGINNCLIDISKKSLILGSNSSQISSNLGLTSIGDRAFIASPKLEKITIPEGIESFGSYAFSGTGAEITFDVAFGGETIGSYAFSGYKGEKITLPSTIKTIKEYAFLDSTADIVLNDGLTTIEEYAFKNCKAIVNLYLPSSVESVGSGAFSGCSSIKTASLPFTGETRNSNIRFGYIFGVDEYEGSVKTQQRLRYDYIGTAYYLPASLDTVTIREGTIKGFAFNNCTTIKNIVVLDDVVAIEDGAFYKCNGIESITLPFIGYSLTTKNTEQSVFGHIFGVVSNSEDGVSQNYTSSSYKKYAIPTSIKTVTITGGTLGYGAFDDCYNITKITLPSDIEVIEPMSFYGCEALQEVNLNSGITEIGEKAFYNCKSLVELTVPTSLVSVKEKAFEGSQIGKVSVSSLDKWLSINFANESASLIYGAPLYINGEEISGAVVLPTNITTIYAGAFYGCDKITSINIPSNIETILDGAFRKCKSLREVTFNDGLKTIGIDAFRESGIETFVAPSTLETISKNAFYGCPNLTSATINSGLTTLGYDSFCDSLKLVEAYNYASFDFLTVHNSYINRYAKVYNTIDAESKMVEDINGFVFLVLDDAVYLVDYRGSNKEITLPANYQGRAYQLVEGMFRESSATSVNTNGAVEIISQSAFKNSSIQSVILTGVKAIEKDAFYECKELTTITMDSTLGSIGESAFVRCTALKSFTFPSDITVIEYSTFQGCTSLESVVLSENITKIDQMAFYKCTALNSVTNGALVNEICSSAFSDCASLTTLQFDTLTTVGEQAFYNCTSLQSIDAPYLKDIARVAFYGCTSLTAVNNESSSVGTIGESAFSGCFALSTIKLNATNVGPYAFKGCVSLVLDENDTLSTVGTESFRDLPLLGTVIFAWDLDEKINVGSYAFAGSGITHITLSSKVEYLGTGAFMDCKNVTTLIHNAPLADFEADNLIFANLGIDGEGVTLKSEKSTALIPANMFYPSTSTETPMTPKLVTMDIREASSLGENAFMNISSLTNIVIPKNISEIGAYAFTNCVNVTKILYCPYSVDSTGESAYLNVGTKTGGAEAIIANSVNEIPANVFGRGGSAYITKVSFEEKSKLETIRAYAFRDYGTIRSIDVFPSSLKKIEYHAFESCARIEKFVIPRSVTNMGYAVFFQCAGYVHCEVTSRPSTWDSMWDYGMSRDPIWGSSG